MNPVSKASVSRTIIWIYNLIKVKWVTRALLFFVFFDWEHAFLWWKNMINLINVLKFSLIIDLFSVIFFSVFFFQNGFITLVVWNIDPSTDSSYCSNWKQWVFSSSFFFCITWCEGKSFQKTMVAIIVRKMVLIFHKNPVLGKLA